MDLEQCCGEALQFSCMQLQYDDHACGISGCAEGLVVVDGIEKVSLIIIIYLNVILCGLNFCKSDKPLGWPQ